VNNDSGPGSRFYSLRPGIVIHIVPESLFTWLRNPPSTCPGIRIVIFHVLWFSLWLWLNSESRSRFAFDPFPYQLLSTVVSLESIFLSLFILMSQNRSNVQADQRNHLDLQINLLSEEENTKMLQMLQAICEHHKLAIGKDPETTAMAQRTEISDVLSELQEHLPASE
jgi:uncharacterized membrane protein